MSAACVHCGGTGMLPGSEYLDCTHCDVASQRVMLETWANEQGIRIDPDQLWSVFSLGNRIGLKQAAAVCKAIQTDFRDQYKGRGKYAPNNPARANPHMDGQSDGALSCVDAIESLIP